MSLLWQILAFLGAFALALGLGIFLMNYWLDRQPFDHEQ